MQQTPEQWYKSIPTVTRIIVTTLFVLTVLFVMGLFSNPMYIMYDFSAVTKKLQIWRLITNYFFIGKFSMSWLFSVYLFCNFSSRLEKNELHQGPGDYLLFILFQMITINFLSMLFFYPHGTPFNFPSLSFAIIYCWSKREPFSQLSYFGFAIQAYQFPFVLLFLNLLMGASIWQDLMGLVSGHLYFFLREVVPLEYNKNILVTPNFLHKCMINVSRWCGPAGSEREAQQQHERVMQQERIRHGGTTGRMFAGQGYRLG